MLTRLLTAALALFLWSSAGSAQTTRLPEESAVFLVANPAFRDADYWHTVLVAAPIPSGGHVGVIINRPTNRLLTSLFPEHEPSKKVAEPVHYGGPFSRGALVALVKTEANPGAGTLQLMRDLYIAFRANTIDKVIEQTPNDARFYVGYVGWRPGELKTEIDRGLWAVLNADRETIFQKEMGGLWEELVVQSRRLRADSSQPALAGKFE